MGAPLRSGFDGDTTEVSFEEKLQYANEPLLAGLVHLEGVSQQEDVVEMAIGYSVLFPGDWEWVKGGKLPGICE